MKYEVPLLIDCYGMTPLDHALGNTEKLESYDEPVNKATLGDYMGNLSYVRHFLKHPQQQQMIESPKQNLQVAKVIL